MFIFCFIWSVKIEFASQIVDYSFMKTSLEAFRESYSFTWGEDISGWLEPPDSKPEIISAIWLLIANICFLNMMVSISSAVFGETQDNWVAGEMEVKNELILQCEYLCAATCTGRKPDGSRRCKLNYFNHEEGMLHKHIIFVEEDQERPDAEVEEKFDAIQEKLDNL